MTDELLRSAAEGIGSLRAIFQTAMPDCLLYAAWLQPGVDWNAEDVASYFGDLVRSNREALKSIGSWSSQMQVTIESGDTLVVLREVDEHFVLGCVFDRAAPLGMVRLHVSRLLERVAEGLPKVELHEKPRAVRVVEFLRRYAPDPHAVLMRVSLRTNLPMELLKQPERLDETRTRRLEEAARQILGIDELRI